MSPAAGFRCGRDCACGGVRGVVAPIPWEGSVACERQLTMWRGSGTRPPPFWSSATGAPDVVVSLFRSSEILFDLPADGSEQPVALCYSYPETAKLTNHVRSPVLEKSDVGQRTPVLARAAADDGRPAPYTSSRMVSSRSATQVT